MAQMVSKQSALGVVKNVLLAPHLAFEIGVQVNSTGVQTNSEGRKVIPAGTPLGGTTSALMTRNTTLQVTNDSSTGANAQGILRYDVDVTDGKANATLIVKGVVDVSKCPSLDNAVKTKLAPNILFVNGGKQ